MKTIFCPTDFSDNAGTAIDYAVQISRKNGARIVLFAAFVMPDRAPGVIQVAQPGLGADTLKKLEELRDGFKAKYPDDNLDIEIHAEGGNAKDVIVEYADEYSADLIVMGTQGATNLEELILGSVTATVINNSERPVLAIPNTCEFVEIKKILFASDLTEDDPYALRQMGEFARNFSSEIDIIHVLDSGKDIPADELERREGVYAKQLGVDSVKISVKENSDIINGVNERLGEDDYHVLAMLTKKRNLITQIFSPSVTRKMAHYANLPMLAVTEFA